ncbi:MAG: rhodanese-related sulfurtransferase [Oceanospirillaceae bacterium]|jgi:rhodanese-related sulfurtransferase
MASPTEITCPQLSRLIGTSDCPIIIDVRIDADFAADPYLIPSAFRHPFNRIIEIADQLLHDKPAHKRVVIYCQKGFKVSQGAAALLRTYGVQTETLQGGQFLWRDAGLPLLTLDNLPAPDKTGATLWVTKHRPKIDRIACPWLIRRFIDTKAKFLFVAPSQVINVAEKFNATPFDVEDVFWSHQDEFCTFDKLLSEFNLHTPALDKLAVIVRAADTNCLELAPEAAGLLAVSLGLSRIYRDDLSQLEAGFDLYDAFYRWARDASNESHHWPASIN